MSYFSTPQDLVDLMNAAFCAGKSGSYNGHNWMYLPKAEHNSAREDNNLASSTLAAVMHSDYKFLMPLKFQLYTIVLRKIRSRNYTPDEVIIVIKGSSALAFRFMNTPYADDFPPSDMDIAVYINPNLDPLRFQQIYDDLAILIPRVFAQFKRDFDRTFFISQDKIRPDQKLMPEDDIRAFKEAMEQNFADIGMGSPFTSHDAACAASGRSYMIFPSQLTQDECILLYPPAFPKAETTPLRKTPIVSSTNILTFNNNGNPAQFFLTRMKIRAMTDKDKKAVPVDFVDCTIPYRYDTELNEFWANKKNGPVTEVINVGGQPAVVPTINMSKIELYNLLFKYESQDNKRVSRLNKLMRLEELFPR